MADVAADVPGKFDVIIDGHGYVFANEIDANLAFRTQRAKYSYSPTFVPRSNVSGNYGDNQQEFWQTASQRDWSLGEGQKYYRANDADSVRMYWLGSNVDVSLQGQVTLNDSVVSSGINTDIGGTGVAYADNKIYLVDASGFLYSIVASGSATNTTLIGAHGAGTVYPRGITTDGFYIYISGTTAFRKYNINSGVFSNFSTGISPMAAAFAGNTMYALSLSEFGRVDSAGAYTALYYWKDAAGGAKGVVGSIHAKDSGVIICRFESEDGKGAELWEYQGGLTKVASLPPNFIADQMDVALGIVFIGGAFVSANNTKYQSAVFYLANGNLGLLWKSSASSTNKTLTALCAFQHGVVFTDETTGNFMFYDPATGSISSIGSFTKGTVAWTNTDGSFLFASGTSFLHTRNSNSWYFYPALVKPSSGYVRTSLFDFDSSLTKYVRGVIVDFDPASDGDGGSVDVSYQLNSLDGSYTSISTGITAGTEYAINQSCRSISIQVTLNKGTSTNGPVLKRVYVRAVPIQQTFRNDEVILDCTGKDGKTPVQLRNGNPHPLDGQQMATNLKASIVSTTPISITDRFGTITGVIDAANSEIIEVRPEEYMARIAFRQV